MQASPKFKFEKEGEIPLFNKNKFKHNAIKGNSFGHLF